MVSMSICIDQEAKIYSVRIYEENNRERESKYGELAKATEFQSSIRLYGFFSLINCVLCSCLFR